MNDTTTTSRCALTACWAFAKGWTRKTCEYIGFALIMAIGWANTVGPVKGVNGNHALWIAALLAIPAGIRAALESRPNADDEPRRI